MVSDALLARALPHALLLAPKCDVQVSASGPFVRTNTNREREPFMEFDHRLKYHNAYETPFQHMLKSIAYAETKGLSEFPIYYDSRC